MTNTNQLPLREYGDRACTVMNSILHCSWALQSLPALHFFSWTCIFSFFFRKEIFGNSWKADLETLGNVKTWKPIVLIYYCTKGFKQFVFSHRDTAIELLRTIKFLQRTAAKNINLLVNWFKGEEKRYFTCISFDRQ